MEITYQSAVLSVCEPAYELTTLSAELTWLLASIAARECLLLSSSAKSERTARGSRLWNHGSVCSSQVTTGQIEVLSSKMSGYQYPPPTHTHNDHKCFIYLTQTEHTVFFSLLGTLSYYQCSVIHQSSLM